MDYLKNHLISLKNNIGFGTIIYSIIGEKMRGKYEKVRSA